MWYLICISSVILLLRRKLRLPPSVYQVSSIVLSSVLRYYLLLLARYSETGPNPTTLHSETSVKF